MKTIMALLSFVSVMSFASVDVKQRYFQFKYEGEVFVYVHPNRDWYEGTVKAAEECMKHYKGDEENDAQRYEELVDVCANGA